MGGDEEAYHPDLLTPPLAGETVLEEMILKHEGIQELMISLVLNLNAGDGENRNDVLHLHTLPIAKLIEAIGEKLLDPLPASVFLLPVYLPVLNVDSVSDYHALHAVEEHGLLHGGVPYEGYGIGITGQPLQSSKAQRCSGLHLLIALSHLCQGLISGGTTGNSGMQCAGRSHGNPQLLQSGRGIKDPELMAVE